MAAALRALTEDALPRRRADRDRQDPAAPASRELLGQGWEEAAVGCLGSPPCLLTVGIIGVAAYAVYVYVHPSALPGKKRHHPRPTTAEPTETADPPVASATSMPTTTTVPTVVPVTRRYPTQTCDDAELDRLQEEKRKLCNAGYAAKCGGTSDNDKEKLAKIPCSKVLLSIQQRRACLAARWAVQDKCFGGQPDARHEKPLDETQGGLDNCEALKLLNCAKGHPMAGR